VEPDSRGKNVAPGLPGGSRYTFGPQEIICAEDYHLEAAVPPGPTASAPFDTAVDPEGYIVMPGSSGTLVRYRDGDFEPLAAPNGHNFECDDRGVFWYYNFPSGEIFRWLPEGGAEDIAELPAAYTDGSIAVAPGGRSVYVARWIRDDDPSKEESALYRYTESRGLEKLLDMPAGELLHAVEVTDDGEVYIATNRGIDRVKGSRRENIYRAPGIHVGSDGLTSDRGENLYFSAYNRGRVGIFSLDRTGKVGLIAANPPGEPLPFGLSFHEPTNRIICVRKESGELLGVGLDGTIEVLNDPSGLTTPIAVEQHPDGRIFVNGDEAGLLEITAGGRAEGFGGEVTSYQPPPADFAFADDGTLYYSEAAPGFVSRIITIDSAESVSELTRAVGAPAGIDVGPDGRVYYADYSKNAVMELLPDGTSRTVRSGIPAPIGLCVDDEGAVWVGAATMEAAENPDALGGIPNSRILRLDPGGRSERSRDLEEVVGPGDMPEAGFVSGITFFDTDAEGNLYVPAGSKLFMRDPSGGIRIIADGFYAARGAAVLDDGSIAVADYGISALYLLRPK
jgi:sugar lactone lactonase YvrE